MAFTLGLDLDGVCADYTSAFRVHCARMLGLDAAALPDPQQWDFADNGWGIRDTDHFLELHEQAVRDGMFRTMDPFDGVSEALWTLSDAGVDIRVITHRLVVKNLHGPSAADTIWWLDKHRIPYRDICFVAAKAQVDADVYIDDAPHNVGALRAAGGSVIIFDAPYNRGLPGARADNWADVTQMVLARKTLWDADHGHA